MSIEKNREVHQLTDEILDSLGSEGREFTLTRREGAGVVDIGVAHPCIVRFEPGTVINIKPCFHPKYREVTVNGDFSLYINKSCLLNFEVEL